MLIVVSTTSVQAKVIVLDADASPGTRFFCVLIVASVSSLLPRVHGPLVLQRWTAVVRAISRAASFTPLLM